MYKIDRMRRDYEKFTKAESYILCFEDNGVVYGGCIDTIPRRMFKVYREKVNGKYQESLFVNVLLKKVQKELMKNVIVLGTSEELIDEKYNKGVMAEMLVYRYFGQEFRGKDNVPFYVSGDINVDGIEIQIKYGRARVCTDGTLSRLKRNCARQFA